MKRNVQPYLAALGAALALVFATAGQAAPLTPPTLEGWAPPPLPTSHPKDFVNATSSSSGGGMMRSMVYNPDPGGTGTITYSDFADNPATDVALVNLAQNLGNDPVRIYEWVRNNVRTEFYFGCNRGAYLTMLERAGNDIDQCALLGALLKVAGYTPIYRLEWMFIPRTASGANTVGVYEWLGVNDDASALSVLSNYSPSFGGDGMLQLVYMWVAIDIPGRGETKFVPSLKPHTVGRKPNLDTLSGYTWNNAAIAGGSGSTTSFSPAINSPNLRSYMNGLATQASNAIHTSATLNDLSGAELARLPLVIPEIVSVTAATATRYPQGLQYTTNEQTTPLSGIPRSYCAMFRVRAGTVDHWFEAPELLGKPLTVEFDGNGAGIIRYDGAEITRDTSGNSSGTIEVEVTYEYPAAYWNGAPPPQAGGKQTVDRQNAVAVIYSFGRTVDRLQKILREVSTKEAISTSNVTLTDRLQVIGHQYVSQVHELVSLGAAYLEYDNRRQISSGFTFLRGGNPIVDMRINQAGFYTRSASAAASIPATSALNMLMGALEGTAIEELSGNRSFGTPSLFDQAMTLGTGAHYITSVSQLNSAGLSNYSDSYLGTGALADIQSHLNSGGHVVVLANSNVTYGGFSFGGYLKVYPTYGGVGTIIKGSLGGVTTGSTGFFSFLNKLWTSAKRFVQTVFSRPPTVSSDPVDLTTGAFYKNDIDLVVGAGDTPNGLQLERHYSSARRLVDPTGLGRGWTHNYHIKLDLGSRSDIDSLRAGVDEVLPVLLAVRHAQDSLGYEPMAARSWLLSCTSLSWAVDQQINTQATVSLGSSYFEFIKRPDASYVPASDLTATLTKQGDGSHDLAFRLGNIVHLRASDGKFTTIKDPFNNTLTAAYDGSNRLQTVTDSYGRSFTFSYDGSGRLTGVSDSTGRSVAYGRDGDTFTFTDAEGKTMRYEMNDPDAGTDPSRRFLLTRVVDARGRTVVENDYDFWKQVWQQRTFGEAGRTTQITINPGIGSEIDPAGGAVRTYFDARGRKNFVVDQAGHLTEWRYDGVDRLVKVITSKGFTTTYAFDANHVMVSEQNPAGDTRTITPDAQTRPSIVRNFEGKETTFEYWSTTSSNIKKITAPGGIVSEFTYDSRGRIQTTHPAAYASGAVDTYAYDASGNVDTITHPADANLSDRDYDDYTYNVRGDLLDFTDRKLTKTSYTYNARRQPLTVTQWEGATARTSQTFYDDAGDVDYTLDASGRETDSEHDALGHLVEVRRGPIGSQVVTLTNSYTDARTLLATSTDALGNSVNYTYYATQQIATVRDPLNRTTTFGYDEDQRRTTSQTPLGFVSTDIWDSRSFKDGVQDAETQLVDYSYDKDGRMTGLGNRLNKSFSWNYDDANRIVTSTTPTGKTTTVTRDTRGLSATVQEPSTQTTTFNIYDAEGRLTQKTDGVGVTTYTYWPNGQLKDVSENGHTTHREYDALNRLSQYQDGEGNTISYGYLPSGELASITYPGNKTVSYGYDDFGRLHTVLDWASRTTTYTYDNASRLTRLDRPNGTYRVQEYDAAGQLRFIKEYKSDNSIITFQELRYDDDGRITYNFIHPKPAAITLAQDDLLYDDDNRLLTWNSQAVSFDADGNMTSGPLPSGTIGGYGYDCRNRLTSAGGSSYRYSPDGHRVEITGTGAATFVVDLASRVLSRTKGGTTTYYIYGLALLYEETGSATKTYHADQVGSTLAMTDNSQTVSDRWTYAPYGAIASRTGSTDTPFQFNGALGVQTETNALLYMRARYYNPRLMRFCNADPIGFGGGMNWYAYCGNNPASFADPFGLEKKGVVKLAALKILEYLQAGGEVEARRQMVESQVIMDRVRQDIADYGTAGSWLRATPGLNIGADIHDFYKGETTFGRVYTPLEWGFKGVSVASTATMVYSAGALRLAASESGVTPRAFWIGQDGEAAARSSGAELMKPSQAALDAAKAGDWTLMRSEARAWAKGATGDVPVFWGDGKGRIFLNDELPELWKNMDKGRVKSLEITF